MKVERLILDAPLVDTGGESRLERWFLAIVRRAGLPRPTLQKVWRADSRTIARDEQRRTELTLRGVRVITFTHEDVRDRPDWVATKLLEAVALLDTWAS